MGAAGPTGSNLVVQPFVRGLADGTHLSCRNFKRPGWCYVSDMMNNAAQPVGYEQIYAINLDGSQTVEVFGVDHGSQNTCASCDADAALAVPTQDGSRVMFGSECGGGTTAPVYEYIAQWPAGVQNGSFDTGGLSPWTLAVTAPAAGSVALDTTTFQDGVASAKISITATDPLAYHLQFLHPGLPIVANHPYTLTLYAKADASHVIPLQVQKDVSPYTIYGNFSFTATTSWAKQTFTFTPNASDSVKIDFNLAQHGGTVWIDEVSMF